MKILFLDVDGVLNSFRTADAFNTGRGDGYGTLAFSTDFRYGQMEWSQRAFKLDPIAVILLRKIIEATGAKIVISSTWRLGSCVDHFNKMFECYDWDTTNIIIDMTGHPQKIRGEDIRQWLSANAHLNITDYVIVDDNSDFYPDQTQHNFVKTNPAIGLSCNSLEQAIEILTKSDRKSQFSPTSETAIVTKTGK